MHKKSPPDKKTGARIARKTGSKAAPGAARQTKNPRSINDLLNNRPGLRRITDAIPVQQSWADWLRATVASELAGHIVSAVPKNAELVVFADSAGWGTRLRYALIAMLPQIAARDAALSRITVRIQARPAWRGL
jgi:Dna[CI] antecedent, DciA